MHRKMGDFFIHFVKFTSTLVYSVVCKLSGMYTFIGGLFLASGAYFPNSLRTIYIGLIHFVLLVFSSPFTLFEAMDMV